MLLFSFFLLTACSSDDDGNPNPGPPEGAVSYAKFTISGPVTNGTFEYMDTADNDFNTQGLIGYSDESLQTPVTASFWIYESYTTSLFMMQLPPVIGTHELPYYNQELDEYYETFILFSINEEYYGEEVTVNLSELNYSGLFINKLYGTFSGDFDLMDQTGQSLGMHAIEGEFALER